MWHANLDIARVSALQEMHGRARSGATRPHGGNGRTKHSVENEFAKSAQTGYEPTAGNPLNAFGRMAIVAIRPIVETRSIHWYAGIHESLAT
jgi:hypothetical protein